MSRRVRARPGAPFHFIPSLSHEGTPLALDLSEFARHRSELEKRMLLVVLVALLLMTLGVGAGGHSRYGYACWLPTCVIVLMLIVLWLIGTPHAHGQY
jgi:hypothetical protein